MASTHDGPKLWLFSGHDGPKPGLSGPKHGHKLGLFSAHDGPKLGPLAVFSGHDGPKFGVFRAQAWAHHRAHEWRKLRPYVDRYIYIYIFKTICRQPTAIINASTKLFNLS